MEPKILENLLSRSQVVIIELYPEPDKTNSHPTVYNYVFPVTSSFQVPD
jgi:hypothetical protein